jgi:hypothetical protein
MRCFHAFRPIGKQSKRQCFPDFKTDGQEYFAALFTALCNRRLYTQDSRPIKSLIKRTKRIKCALKSVSKIDKIVEIQILKQKEKANPEGLALKLRVWGFIKGTNYYE